MGNGENTVLSAFPSNRSSALAYLYVKAQDLTGKTPTEIHNMYLEAYYEIEKDNYQKKLSGWYETMEEEAYKD